MTANVPFERELKEAVKAAREAEYRAAIEALRKRNKTRYDMTDEDLVP